MFIVITSSLAELMVDQILRYYWIVLDYQWENFFTYTNILLLVIFENHIRLI